MIIVIFFHYISLVPTLLDIATLEAFFAMVTLILSLVLLDQ